MTIAANIVVGAVALLHLGFMVLEMFLWERPFGMRTFGLTPDIAHSSRALAANQGLYNGFLALGLLWGLVSGRRDLKVFFLCCVIAAGVYGGVTAKMSILYVQAGPALAALLVPHEIGHRCDGDDGFGGDAERRQALGVTDRPRRLREAGQQVERPAAADQSRTKGMKSPPQPNEYSTGRREAAREARQRQQAARA